jgi:hypothetical protein
MKISYAICVCNESKDLYSLISFLKKIKDQEDEINVLVDSTHVTSQVRSVLEYFKDDIVQNDRDFDGKFSTHRNYHFEKCSGDYIFIIDPDEMPHEVLIENIKNIINETGSELIWTPRINICPGFTQEWLDKHNFRVNEMGWINWPDYICRVCKNSPSIRYNNELHEKIVGTDKQIQLQANPSLSTWHIKSIEKQDNRWNNDGTFNCPEKDNLYDNLM